MPGDMVGGAMVVTSLNSSLINIPFSDSSWVKDQVSLSSSVADPLGGTSAFKIAAAANSNAHFVRRSSAGQLKNGATYRISCYIAPAGLDRGYVGAFDGTSDFATVFNVTTGSIVGNRSGSGSEANTFMHLVAGTAWYRCGLEFTAGNTGDASFGFQVGLRADDDLSFADFLGNGTDGCFIWNFEVIKL